MLVVLHILECSLLFVKGFSLIPIKKERRITLIIEKIESLCKKKGISISRLEKEVGLGNATIRGWEFSSPKVENLVKVADYFGVTVDDLLTDQKEESA